MATLVNVDATVDRMTIAKTLVALKAYSFRDIIHAPHGGALHRWVVAGNRPRSPRTPDWATVIAGPPGPGDLEKHGERVNKTLFEST